MSEDKQERELKPWETSALPGEDILEEDDSIAAEEAASCQEPETESLSENVSENPASEQETESSVSRTIIINQDYEENFDAERNENGETMSEELLRKATETHNPVKKALYRKVGKQEEKYEILSEGEKDDPTFKLEREYSKIEYNDKGLIKRSGYATKISYGPDFEKEHMNAVYKFAIVISIGMMLLLIFAIVFVIWFFRH